MTPLPLISLEECSSTLPILDNIPTLNCIRQGLLETRFGHFQFISSKPYDRRISILSFYGCNNTAVVSFVSGTVAYGSERMRAYRLLQYILR